MCAEQSRHTERGVCTLGKREREREMERERERGVRVLGKRERDGEGERERGVRALGKRDLTHARQSSSDALYLYLPQAGNTRSTFN